MKRRHDTSCQASPSENTAAGAAFAEAVRESGVSLPHAVLARLRNSLLPRIASATPRLLTSTRSACPSCSRSLRHSDVINKRTPRAKCWIYGEPAAFHLLHVPRWCQHCVTTCAGQDDLGNTFKANRSIRLLARLQRGPRSRLPTSIHKGRGDGVSTCRFLAFFL